MKRITETEEILKRKDNRIVHQDPFGNKVTLIGKVNEEFGQFLAANILESLKENQYISGLNNTINVTIEI